MVKTLTVPTVTTLYQSREISLHVCNTQQRFHASTYITELVHIGAILQKYPHKIDKAVHTCLEQWCVAVLKITEKKLK
jgi:hypothetical protein